MKKILSTLFSTLQGGARGGLLILALIASSSLWAQRFQSGELYYNITSSSEPYTVEVTYEEQWSENNYAGLTTATIPETVTYNGTTYSVTSIGDEAFEDCSSLSSITIPNSVTSIVDDAFYRCSSLTSITIPNSVTSIGVWAFRDCSSLTSITIPNSVTSIGDGAFEDTGIYNDESNWENGVLYISNCLIDAKTNITGAYSIKDSTRLIADYAFRDCSSLSSITIPNSVTSIGEKAFYGCSSLKAPVYNAHCFAYMPPSYSGAYTIPNGIKQIAGGAFNECSSLSSITIPNSVTSIGDEAFYECSSLTSITIPNSVTSIGGYAFEGCSSLSVIICKAETPASLGSSVFDGVSKSIPVYVPCGCVSAYKTASGWKVFTNIQEPQAEYSIQVSTSNSSMGSAKVDYNTFCEGAKISAEPNYGYHFARWSDGVTDNPRTFILTQDTTFTAEFAQTFSGQCGENLYWSYQNSTLTISGSGEMYDNRPWGLFINEIQNVVLPNGITHIGDDAFNDCTGLSEITIPYTVISIGDYAFAGCRKLVHVNCYAINPPIAKTTSFANYNVYLKVPCDNLQDYQLDMVFGSFKYIQCMGAELDDIETDDVIVNAGSNSVTITWPTEEDADSYTIVIMKDGEVVCTLTFNSDGQLLNIAFMPGREGNHAAHYAQAVSHGTGTGFRFTVTGLEEGTDYDYTITAKDEADNTVATHTGDFKTNAPTAVDNIGADAAKSVEKLLRNGQLTIIRDGKAYNVVGQIVE